MRMNWFYQKWLAIKDEVLFKKQLYAMPKPEDYAVYYENFMPAAAPAQSVNKAEKLPMCAASPVENIQQGKYMGSAVARYCTVVGRNVFVDGAFSEKLKHHENVMDCMNLRSCIKEHGKCTNTTYGIRSSKAEKSIRQS